MLFINILIWYTLDMEIVGVSCKKFILGFFPFIIFKDEHKKGWQLFGHIFEELFKVKFKCCAFFIF